MLVPKDVQVVVVACILDIEDRWNVGNDEGRVELSIRMTSEAVLSEWSNTNGSNFTLIDIASRRQESKPIPCHIVARYRSESEKPKANKCCCLPKAARHLDSEKLVLLECERMTRESELQNSRKQNAG